MVVGNGPLSRCKSSPARRIINLPLKKHKQTESTEHMTKQTQAMNNEMGQLADDARALMTATADVAGEKVADARKRLAAALDSAKEMAGRVRDKAVEGARMADETVREHFCHWCAFQCDHRSLYIFSGNMMPYVYMFGPSASDWIDS